MQLLGIAKSSRSHTRRLRFKQLATWIGWLPSLFDTLETQGQGDLLLLLVENELSRTMDELIQRAAHGTADGLRALGSTAQIDLASFTEADLHRSAAVSPESPPLSTFLEAVQLFADAFTSRGGFRLLRISRPPILFYGLYGVTVEDADQRRLNLIIERGLLADQLDCFMQCACTSETVKCQVILDKILYDLDRSIDLYAMGKDDFGQPERRAAAYSFVIEAFSDSEKIKLNANQAAGCGLYQLDNQGNLVPKDISGIASRLAKIIDANHLRPNLDAADQTVSNMVKDITNFADQIKQILNQQRIDGTTLCEDPPKPKNPNDVGLCKEINDATVNLKQNKTLANILALYKKVQEAQVRLLNFGVDVVLPSSVQDFLGILQQELCQQADTEDRWENLVRTMAPNCAGLTEVFNAIAQVIQDAIDKVSVIECPEFKPSIPPHFETSLDSIVDDVDRRGRGRPTV